MKKKCSSRFFLNFFLYFLFKSLIISLFGLAVSQYKTYRCPRTRRYLVLQMADEYYESKDYGKALTYAFIRDQFYKNVFFFIFSSPFRLYSHMLWDFRAEKWWLILSSILEKGITCAFLTASVQEYLSLAIELLGSNTLISLDDKRRVYENFMRILKVLYNNYFQGIPQGVSLGLRIPTIYNFLYICIYIFSETNSFWTSQTASRLGPERHLHLATRRFR